MNKQPGSLGDRLRSKDGIAVALEMCHQCEHYGAKSRRCDAASGVWESTIVNSKCNLFAADAACPVGKWGPEKLETLEHQERPTTKKRWSVGVTTTERNPSTLRETLGSIGNAGWTAPHLFVDGSCKVPSGFEVTRRGSVSGAFVNWWLAIQELVMRSPMADFYAMFQDDIVLAKGAREAAESVPFEGVLSLYQSSHHKSEKIERFRGGRTFVGALALVFSNAAAHRLVSSSIGIKHRMRPTRNNDYIDGALGDWCEKHDVPLYIHGPSLVQHTGEVSTLGHQEEPSATFVGEDYDSRQLIAKAAHTGTRREGLGLVGFNTAQGLGYVNRDIAKHLDIKRWLTVDHSRHPDLDPIEGVPMESCTEKATTEQLRGWLEGLESVVFVEVVPDRLPAIAQAMGVRTICVPMVEWLPVDHEWMSHVDLWLAPTMFSFNQLVMRDVLGEIRYTPWPIDVEAFPFRERHRCERFVFAHGNGGPRDRKGGKIVAEAARLRPNIPLIVYSQAQEGYRSTLTEDVDWPASVDFRGAVPKPQDLYREGDVMILPSRWEGLGLQLFESLASGMPLVTTDAPPMNEAHAWARLPCEPKRIRLSHDYLSFDVSPRTLADAMWRLSGQEISNESHISRDWVESNRSWHVLGERVQRAIQEPL